MGVNVDEENPSAMADTVTAVAGTGGGAGGGSGSSSSTELNRSTTPTTLTHRASTKDNTSIPHKDTINPIDHEEEEEEDNEQEEDDLDLSKSFPTYELWWDVRLVIWLLPIILIFCSYSHYMLADFGSTIPCAASGRASVKTRFTWAVLDMRPQSPTFWVGTRDNLAHWMGVHGIVVFYSLADLCGSPGVSHNAWMNGVIYAVFSTISLLIGPAQHGFTHFSFESAVSLYAPSYPSDWYEQMFYRGQWHVFFTAYRFAPWDYISLLLFVRPLKLLPLHAVVLYWSFSFPLHKTIMVEELMKGLFYVSSWRGVIVASGVGPSVITLFELFAMTCYFSLLIPLALKIQYFILTRAISFLRFVRIRDSVGKLRAARADGTQETLNELHMCCLAGKSPGHVYDESPRDEFIRQRYPSIKYPNEERVLVTIIGCEDGFLRIVNRTFLIGLSNSIILYCVMVKDLLYTVFHFGFKFDEAIQLLNLEIYHPTDAISFTGSVRWAFFLVDRVWLRPTAAPKELLGIFSRTIDVADLSPAVKSALESREKSEKRKIRSGSAVSRLSLFSKRQKLQENMQMGLTFNMEKIAIINLPPIFRKRQYTVQETMKKQGAYSDPETGFWMNKVIEEVQFHNFRRFWFRAAMKLFLWVAPQIWFRWVTVVGQLAFFKESDSQWNRNSGGAAEIAFVVFDVLEILVVMFAFHWRCRNTRRYATDHGRMFPYLWATLPGLYMLVPAQLNVYWLWVMLTPDGANSMSFCDMDPQHLWYIDGAKTLRFSERIKFSNLDEYYDHLGKEGIPTPFPKFAYKYHIADPYQYNRVFDDEGHEGLYRGVMYDYPINAHIPLFMKDHYYPSRAEINDPAMKNEIVEYWGEAAYNRMHTHLNTLISRHSIRQEASLNYAEDFWDIDRDVSGPVV
eukprot:GHVQ01021585.1.p1 GENE.GHVQ01021585.1~~GHVQ01021585.1.p1  ORF type:complete len:907 (+),score=91.01 GHVQ01021585.1:247-2967(+)